MAERKKREACGCYDRKAPGHKCAVSAGAVPKPSKRISRFYAVNRLLRSFNGKYFFCRKVELLSGGAFRVVGVKYDVTSDVEAMLKSAKKKAKPR